MWCRQYYIHCQLCYLSIYHWMSGSVAQSAQCSAGWWEQAVWWAWVLRDDVSSVLAGPAQQGHWHWVCRGWRVWVSVLYCQPSPSHGWVNGPVGTRQRLGATNPCEERSYLPSEHQWPYLTECSEGNYLWWDNTRKKLWLWLVMSYELRYPP